MDKNIINKIKSLPLRFIIKMALLSLIIIIALILLFLKSYPLSLGQNTNSAKEVLYTSAKISDEDLLNKIKFGRLNEIESLFALGANPNAVDNINRNAMIIAAIFNGNPNIIPLLQKYGVNINHQDINGYNALMLNILSGGNNLEFTKALIQAGANVNTKTNSGISVLMVATGATNDEKLIENLIKAGANVNYKNAESVTPLMVAAKITTNPKVIETLLKYGANTKDVDSLGISIYEIAKSNSYLNKNTKLLNKLK